MIIFWTKPYVRLIVAIFAIFPSFLFFVDADNEGKHEKCGHDSPEQVYEEH